MLYRLPIVVFALLLTACGSDSEINVQYFTETWKTALVGKNGEQIGYGYYVFDRPDSDEFGTSYQIIFDRSGHTVFEYKYKILRTSREGRIVYFERDAAGWVKVKFEIIDHETNQAKVDERAWNKVYDEDEKGRIRLAIEEYSSGQ